MNTSSIYYDGPELGGGKKGALNNVLSYLLRNQSTNDNPNTQSKIDWSNVMVSPTQTLAQFLSDYSSETTQDLDDQKSNEVLLSDAIKNAIETYDVINTATPTKNNVDDVLIGIMKVLNPVNASIASGKEEVNELVKSITEYSFVADANSGNILSPTTGLVSTVRNSVASISKYFVNGKFIKKTDTQVSLSSTSDNYIYITELGQYEVLSQAIGDPEPSVSGLLLWKVATNSSSVTAKTDLRSFTSIKASQIIDGAINGSKLTDGSVTSSKLADLLIAATKGSTDFMTLTYNAKGQITAADAKILITSLADGQFLRYESASGKWKNVTVAPGSLPSGVIGDSIYHNGTTWDKNSFLKMYASGMFVGNGAVSVSNAIQLAKDITLGTAIKNPSVSVVSAGPTGTLVNGTTYYYKICFKDSSGLISIGATEINFRADASNKSALITIGNQPNGAVDIVIYRGVTSGVYTDYYTGAFTLSLTDTGSVFSSIPSGSEYTGTDLARSGSVKAGQIVLGAQYTEAGDTQFYVKNLNNTNGKLADLLSRIDNPTTDYTSVNIDSRLNGTVAGLLNIALSISATGGDAGKNIAIWINEECGSIVVGDHSTASPNAGIAVTQVGKTMAPPRMTTAQRDAIVVTTDDGGGVIFNTTTNKLEYFNGSAWIATT